VSVTGDLSHKHEVDIAEAFNGRISKASGSQWNGPADGRHSRYKTSVAFAWDCKAAMPGTKSISVTRAMLDKIEEQALGERPMIPLRFYSSERGAIEHDWIALKKDDLQELIERLHQLEEMVNG
jgi:hypothetical protein